MAEKKSKKTLSKSSYIKGLQCLKHLYLYKNRYFLRDPVSYEQQMKFRRGHAIGELAQQLFPGGINLKPGHASRYAKAAERTREAIAQKTPTIYEAVFLTEHYIAILDILTLENGEYHAWEVKSSLKVSETYLNDLAFQIFVMSELGFKPQKAGIIYINKDYIFNHKIELDKLFLKIDLTEKVNELQEATQSKAEMAYNTMFAKSSPKIEVGPHCFYPYSCDFRTHCHKKLTHKDILNIAGISIEKKYELLHSETSDIYALEDDFTKNQITAIQNQKDIFDEDLLHELYENISIETLPAFVHITSIRKALPEQNGDRPFMRKPISIAILTEEEEIVKTYSTSDAQMEKILSLIETHASEMQIIILEDEKLLPSFFEESIDNKGFELINLYDYFTQGIWCKKQFAPDYEAERIRNAALDSRPQYFDRLALLLDMEKDKIDNPDASLHHFTLSNAKAVRNIFNRLYEEYCKVC